MATFIRTPQELASLAGCQPFPEAQFDAAVAFNVAFLKEPLDDVLVQKLMLHQTDIDDFRVRGREVYWLCRKKQSESSFFERRAGEDYRQAIHAARDEYTQEDGGEILLCKPV